jgi:hypothetical protein
MSFGSGGSVFILQTFGGDALSLIAVLKINLHVQIYGSKDQTTQSNLFASLVSYESHNNIHFALCNFLDLRLTNTDIDW